MNQRTQKGVSQSRVVSSSLVAWGLPFGGGVVFGLIGLGLGAGGCAPPRPLETLPDFEVPIERQPPPAEDVPPRTAPVEEKRPDTDQPDPKPVISAEQLKIRLRFERGRVVWLGTEAVRLKEPRTTPRMLGRFALEAWIGGELLERLRFDFPLIGGEEEKDLEQGLVTELSLFFPDLERATRFRVLDRKTGTEVEVGRLGAPPSSGAAPEAPSDESTPGGAP